MEKADLECHPVNSEGVGGDTLSEPESSDEEDHTTLPSLGDIQSRQAGGAVSIHQLKWTRIETGHRPVCHRSLALC
jgi:hypothetical protein